MTRSAQNDKLPDAVALAYVHDVEVAYSWHHSITQLLMFDGMNHGRIMRGGYIGIRCAKSADLIDSRNKAVQGFLTKDAEWMFWIDTDMGFEPDVVERLLSSADAKERPIVGGLCFAQKEVAQDGMGGFATRPRVTILDYVDVDGKGNRFIGRANYPVNALVKCAGTGAACIVIHRSVFEAIQKEYGDTWYNRIPGVDGTLLGEDVSFCVRAGSLGFPIHVNTAAKTSHFKNLWVQEADFWQMMTPPPATEEAAILVPVMERPENAEPFMQSLRASTGLAKVYAIANEQDTETIKAWQAVGATVFETDLVTFPEKINYGYKNTTEPWVFLAGDDVDFHSGWLDQAIYAANNGQFHVVGTNDLGNERVTSGDHAVHMLVRRSYVDEVGAGWDGPGVLCHEGYRHWFCDDEVVTAAKQRGVWAMCLSSIVEHMHPEWGKAHDDEVYSRGRAAEVGDRKTFKARYRKHVKGANKSA